MADSVSQISRIREWLYLGSLAAEKSSLQDLRELTITHVVQVGTNQFMSPSHPEELKYCCVPALDHEGEDLLVKLQHHNVHAFMDGARQKGGTVLVHCFAGVSRSATVAISYLMKDEGLTFEESLADLISRRDCVAPNRGFCDQLKILQEQCDSKLELYRPEMLQDSKKEMSTKQWLALLLRTKEASQRANGGHQIEDTQAGALGLQSPACSLEESKQRGISGHFKRDLPPEGDHGERGPPE